MEEGRRREAMLGKKLWRFGTRSRPFPTSLTPRALPAPPTSPLTPPASSRGPSVRSVPVDVWMASKTPGRAAREPAAAAAASRAVGPTASARSAVKRTRDGPSAAATPGKVAGSSVLASNKQCVREGHAGAASGSPDEARIGPFRKTF
jgi:hypothetical protein